MNQPVDDTGTVVGWAAASLVSSREVYRGVMEHSVYIHPDQRGHGIGHQFHVGVDAFGYAPIPFTLVDARLDDLRREEEEIAAIVRERTALGESTPLSELAEKFGIDLDANEPTSTGADDSMPR